jgi:DNA polymerase-3 subunit epsilon
MKVARRNGAQKERKRVLRQMKKLVEVVRDCLVDSGARFLVDAYCGVGFFGIEAGDLVLGDSFHSLIRVSQNTPAVTVHGVTRDESRKGVDEAAALEAFLDYLRDGVIVGHHIGHDVATFNAGYERHWGVQMLNRSLDTMDLALLLERDGAFAGQPAIRHFTLDALCERFGVIPHDRHTATGDAFITGQVLGVDGGMAMM